MTQTTQTNSEVVEQKTNDKEYNFAQIRKQLETERLARQQAEARIAEVERIAQERLKPANDDDDDEPYVDNKKLEKKLNVFKKTQEQEIDQRISRSVQQALEEERHRVFLKENPDYNVVMSNETLEKFQQTHPDIANKIIERYPDGPDRHQFVYKLIKEMGIDKPKQKEPSVQEKINANMKSPFMPSPGVSGPGYSAQGDFSPAGQKSAYDQVQALKKRIYGTR